MTDRETVIYDIERCICHVPDACRDCSKYGGDNAIRCMEELLADALSLLKAQELLDVKPEKLEERTTKWLDQMTAEERLAEIAAILDDWDGYRTAKGLAGLINEVWAYALYPVKAHEPRVMTLEEVKNSEVLYFEDFTDPSDGVKPIIRPAVNIEVKNGGILMLDSVMWDDGFTFSTDEEYGKTWRCWTSRPTDEQREAVKWDE